MLHSQLSTTLLITTSLLTGCTTSILDNTQRDGQPYESGFCYNGGRINNYSCDPELAVVQADMREKEIDEEWMYLKLIEIRHWLAMQRQEFIKRDFSPETTTNQEQVVSCCVRKPD